MDKLSVKSALQLLENMSYEDSKQLEDIIIKKYFNNLFVVKAIYNKKIYNVKSKSKEDAIDTFINKIMLDKDYTYQFVSSACCNKCNSYINVGSKRDLIKHYEHYHTNEDIKEFYLIIFNQLYTCKIFCLDDIGIIING